MRITRTLFLALATVAAACSDSPNEPETVGVSGSLSFTYNGAGASAATQYSATGAIPSNFGTNNGTQPWAAGAVDNSSNSTIVYGFIPTGSNTWNWSYIQIARTTVGTSTISSSCTANTCTELGVWFGMNNNGTNYSYLCTLTSGTVSITAISSTNATGTFSGSGTCLAAAGGETAFTVTNGNFNVGLTALLQ